MSKQTSAMYMRNFVFGVEDSLVSTLGLLSGVATAGLPKMEIFWVGIILIFVEAFSMSVGSYLSEGLSDNYLSHKGKKQNIQTIFAALIMLGSYFLSGFIPLGPYLLFDIQTAFVVSIVLSLLALFVLGFTGARLFHLNSIKNGIKTLTMGGGALVVGILVGKYLGS